MHRRSLERFPFDSVLLPYSYVQMQDPLYAADTEALLRECAARRVGVQTIKGICRGPWGSKEPGAATWYDRSSSRRTSILPCIGSWDDKKCS